MRKFYLLLIMVFFTAATYATNIISPEAARSVAKNFMSERTGSKDVASSDFALTKTVTDENGDALYYIFNMKKTGFIIISASELVSPVLAFSVESNYVGNESSIYMEEKYKSQIKAVNSNPELADPKAAAVWNAYSNSDAKGSKGTITGPYVEPLVTTVWNQTKYYNQYCPYNAEAGASSDYRVPNGCVALTLTNILNYYRYPETGVGGVSYVSIDYGTDEDGNPFVNHDYGRIKEYFTGPYDYASITDDVRDYQGHLGKLTYHTGASARMNYGVEGSGSNGEYALNALKTNWKMNENAALRLLSAYANYKEWVDVVVIPELNALRPLYYAGYSETYGQGHAWILDGYVTIVNSEVIAPDSVVIDTTKYFHVNWGWGGSDNGFYKIDLLNTTSFHSFSSNESAIVNIAPADSILAKPISSFDTLYAKQGSVCDGAGNQKYQPNSERSWLIAAPNATSYVFNFRRLKTQKDVDEIIIYDGPNVSDGVKARYSGNYLNKAVSDYSASASSQLVDFEGDRLPGDLTVNKPSVLIVFKSNSDSITDYGFNINYTANISNNSNSCSDEILPNYSTHRILSDKIDLEQEGNYFAHTNCGWRINCTFIDGYTFGFRKFDLAFGDFVDVFDNITGAPELLYRFDIDNPPGGSYTVTPTSGRLLVKFSSDNVSEGEGFELEYWALISGVENISGIENVQVYPNPATNVINIDYSTANAENITFQLMDITGRVVAMNQVNHSGGTSTHNIDVSSLSNGVYVLKIQSSQGAVTKKVIVN